MIFVKIKEKKHRYLKEQIETVCNLLDINKPISEISKASNLSNRQVKKIRYIHKNANQKEKEMLLECKYLISSIERNIKIRIKAQKKEKV